MKYIPIIFFFFISSLVFASESENNEVEVIDLYESKSLDQMVLDNINTEEAIEEIDKQTDFNDKTGKISSNEVEANQVKIVNDKFLFKNDTNDLKNYLDNLLNIRSKTLQNQLIVTLENLQLNLENEKENLMFFSIINYMKSIGQINKSYELIEKNEISNDKNFNFYTNIKLDYLLSTMQLDEACNFKEELNSDVKLDFFFLEKLDIFCLLLNDNKSEASLLNSILIETESNSDNYFQFLFSYISNSSDLLNEDIKLISSDINSELIFLYSAMKRIADLPFSNIFYELDKKNLSIPIILNQSSPIDLRIKAANESFIDNLITVDSLAALYMSADFNSDQLSNPKKTLDSFTSNKELNMAFLFQLVNIQIFPTDRLNALIQFWDFATKNNLEEVAYKLSNNMLNSIEATGQNIIHAPQIASAYIFNNNFEKAVYWIELYENAKQVDSKSVYIRVLLDLYSSTDLDSFINSINLTLNNYTDNQSFQNEELLFVLKVVMNLDIKSNININLDKIFDERSMPSISLLNEINNTIINDEDQKFLIYSIISINDKEWNKIHPEHLNLILEGYLKYSDGVLFRNIILEIFKNYKFII